MNNSHIEKQLKFLQGSMDSLKNVVSSYETNTTKEALQIIKTQANHIFSSIIKGLEQFEGLLKEYDELDRKLVIQIKDLYFEYQNFYCTVDSPNFSINEQLKKMSTKLDDLYNLASIIVDKQKKDRVLSFVYSDSTKIYPIDYSLIDQYPGSLYYKVFNETFGSSSFVIKIDHSGKNHTFLMKYMKKKTINYSSFTTSQFQSFLDDIEFFQLPFRNELFVAYTKMVENRDVIQQFKSNSTVNYNPLFFSIEFRVNHTVIPEFVEYIKQYNCEVELLKLYKASDLQYDYEHQLLFIDIFIYKLDPLMELLQTDHINNDLFLGWTEDQIRSFFQFVNQWYLTPYSADSIDSIVMYTQDSQNRNNFSLIKREEPLQQEQSIVVNPLVSVLRRSMINKQIINNKKENPAVPAPVDSTVSSTESITEPEPAYQHNTNQSLLELLNKQESIYNSKRFITPIENPYDYCNDELSLSSLLQYTDSSKSITSITREDIQSFLSYVEENCIPIDPHLKSLLSTAIAEPQKRSSDWLNSVLFDFQHNNNTQ